MANLSLEQIQPLCFNRGVNLDDLSSAPISASPVLSNVISFSDLRLRQDFAHANVLIEYEGRPGDRSVHEVSLTCAAQGGEGAIYLGGYTNGKFSIFRADRIHLAIIL